MNTNIKHDAFDELFRNKLEGHRIEVDYSVLDDIERSLNDTNKKSASISMWRIWAITALATAASVAAMVIFRPVENLKTDETAIQDVYVTVRHAEHTPVRHAELVSVSSENEDIAGQAVHTSIRHTELVSVSPINNEIAGQARNDANVKNIVIENDTIINSVEDFVVQLSDNSIIANDTVSRFFISSIIDEISEEDVYRSKDTRKWLFAAVLGVGGNIGDDTEGLSASNLASASLEELSNTLSKPDIKNVSHSPPFSFGITARKRFTENLGIKSGLVYTYLSSRFEWSQWSNYKAYQGLHYIGVPVDLDVYLGNSKSDWRFYVSGGFMVEKGLQTVYKQEENWGNHIRLTTENSSIDGLQWSLNLGFGVRYKLEKGWGIYFEPRAGYSFDNNQPISIRAEYPFFFGVNFGLNYGF